jgi:hypothetical protein
MFSWATSHLEKLAQTVAPPPPTDSFASLLYCCQRGDDDGAVSWVMERQAGGNITGNNSNDGYGGSSSPIDPVRSIVQQVKGQTILHWSCFYGLPRLLELCLQWNQQQHPQPFPLSSLTDLEGNTPLHHAAMSDRPNALDISKFLLQHDTSGLIQQQNRQAKTAYDVAVRDTVRQFLLPLQLQAETQAAIDNGGLGLPPGIDLGGLTIQNQNLAPPPTMSMGIGGGGGGATPQSLYPPTPGFSPPMPPPPPPQQWQQSPPPLAYPNNSMPQSQQMDTASTTSSLGALPPPPPQSQPFTQVATTAAAAASTSVGGQSVDNTAAMPPPPPPRPPTSSGSSSQQHAYARTGRSSAAILQTRSGIQPDGFHSSSSDKNLQEKYGHVNVHTSHLPPPPKSGNGVGLDLNSASGVTAGAAAASAGWSSAPPSLNNGTNPFAGGMAAVNPRVTSARRYVTYDPFAGSALPRPPAPTGYGQPLQQHHHQTTTSNFAAPVAMSNPTPAQATAAPAAAFHGQGTMTAASGLASPPVMYGQTPANTPVLRPWTDKQHPQTATLSDDGGGGATSIGGGMYGAAATSPSTPSTTSLGGFTPPPYSSGYHRSTSGGAVPVSNTAVASPSAATAAALFAQPSAVATASPLAAALPPFATSGTAVGESTNSEAPPPSVSSTATTTRTAMELFGATEPMDASTAAMKAEPPSEHVPPPSSTVMQPEALTASFEAVALNDEDLDDIPLTPGEDVRRPVTASGETSTLMDAIGMPPPPFSRKY